MSRILILVLGILFGESKGIPSTIKSMGNTRYAEAQPTDFEPSTCVEATTFPYQTTKPRHTLSPTTPPQLDYHLHRSTHIPTPISATMASTNPLSTPPGSELFTTYEAELSLITADLSQKLDALPPPTTPEPRKASLAACARLLDEADELLASMRLEKQNIPAASKQKTNQRFRNHESDVDTLRRRHKAALQEGASDKARLLGSRYTDNPGDEQVEQRQQLLSGTDRLERSSGRLRESQRIALETEDIGRNTLADLGRQRETIEHTRGTLLESEGYTDRSNKTLKGMARRWVPSFF